MLIKLAFRNIFRRPGRTCITLLVIISGSMAIILANGFKEDTIRTLRDATIKNLVGHLRIYHRGYFDKGLLHPFDYRLTQTDALIEKIKALPHVRVVGPRLNFDGLVSNGETTLSFNGEAFDPERETTLESGESIVAGKRLQGKKSYAITVGKGLAGALQVAPGGSLVLVSNTEHGAMNAMDVTVEGVFETISKEFDDHALRLPMELAQRLLRTQSVETLVVFLDETRFTDTVKASLQKLLAQEHLDDDVKAWYELDDGIEVTKLDNVYKAMFGVLNIIVLVVVTFGIMNTMNIIVLERTGEIGTLMALGTPPRRVAALFITEGFILGGLGSILGCLGGYVVALLISKIGIPMPNPPGYTGVWIGRIATPISVFIPALTMGILTSVLSSVLPAWKAARMEIAEALRHNL